MAPLAEIMKPAIMSLARFLASALSPLMLSPEKVKTACRLLEALLADGNDETL